MLTGKAGLGADMEVNGPEGEPGTRSNKLEPDLHTWAKIALLLSGKQFKITPEKSGLMQDTLHFIYPPMFIPHVFFFFLKSMHVYMKEQRIRI